MHKTGLMSSGKAMKRMLISLPLFLALVLVGIGYYLKPVASSTQKSAAISVDVMIPPDQVDLGSTGDIAVAILSTAKFSADEVDPASVKFAGASTMKLSGGASGKFTIEATDAKSSEAADARKGDGNLAFQIELKDANNDGLSDLVAYFSIPYLLELQAGSQQARLSAYTFDGRSLEGYATVNAFGQSALRGDGGGVSGPTGGGGCPTTVTLTNSTTITIPSSGNGSPYPSTINVAGLTGVVSNAAGSVQVAVNGFSHTFPDDIGFVLVGPTSAALLVQDGAGSGTDMVNVTYTLSDTGAGSLPDLGAWVAGTYKPTSYYTGDSFPAPGPGLAYSNPGPVAGGTATFSSVYGGTNPNGNWNLYLVDFVPGDSDQFPGGWSLSITTVCPAACTITCPNNVTQGNDTGACSAVVNYPAPMTTGTCGTVSCSPTSGSMFPVGTTTVTCTTTAGPSCSFTVTVVDNTSPTIMCPNPVSQQNDPNQCGAVVNYPPPTVGDNCQGVGTPVCSPQSGSFFPVGATTVTCRVSDATTCENIFAVDTSDNLVNFRTSAPGIISSRPIQGLGVNEDVVGIDFRPATGQLFGLVRDSVSTALRLITINVVTGATAQVGSAFAASGIDFGFDFNPTVDRIRITSDAETNLSVNPDTGTVTVQTPLNPGNPNVVGSAYTNNFVGATVTTLYAIDSGDDTLKTQNPPANGTLSNVGSLGVDTTGNVGFDISQCGGTAYAALETFNNQGPTGGGSSLYTINLGSGAATLVGGISGNTIRAMSIEIARTSYCSFTVTVNDTQPPTLTCPAVINTAAAVSCPIAASSVVTYTTPVPTDNCPGVTVACNPPSGSTFAVGCTTVTCTATDASGNTASCSFQVCVFSFCLQDGTNPGNVVLVNVQTGDYIFCCNGVFVASGRGVVTLRGCAGTIEDNKGDRKVEIRFDTSVDGNRGNGSATLKMAQLVRCQITDQDMSNNTCVCSNQPPPGRVDLK